MASCESCSMTIESGPYCDHCTDEKGSLLEFEECLTRFMLWTKRTDPDISDEEARTKTLAYMGKMPAWMDHPRLEKIRD